VRIFVTGGSGFVGRNLTASLIQKGHEVTIVSTGAEPQIPGVKKVTYMTLTGIDWKSLENQDAVIHLMANNDTRCQDDKEMFRANTKDSLILLNRAVEYGCKKFIFASSTAVYGDAPAPYIEGKTPENPLTVYGKSKITFEHIAKYKKADIPIIGLRYCNIYGPGEEDKGKRMSMIGQIIRTMLRGKQPKLFKWGEQKRDWVYVDDVVQANLLALESEKSGIYNIGSGSSGQFNQIVGIINELTNQNIEPIYVDCPFSEEYQNHTECDIEKARKELGYFPSFDLRYGIKSYLNYLELSASSPSF
jgi:ADP-L-glycero-D-manno-heptose 6-epimerase